MVESKHEISEEARNEFLDVLDECYHHDDILKNVEEEDETPNYCPTPGGSSSSMGSASPSYTRTPVLLHRVKCSYSRYELLIHRAVSTVCCCTHSVNS